MNDLTLSRIVSIFLGIGCSNQEAVERFLPRDLLRRLSHEYENSVYIILPSYHTTSATASIQHDDSLPIYFRDYCSIITCDKSHSTLDKLKLINSNIKSILQKRKKLQKVKSTIICI